MNLQSGHPRRECVTLCTAEDGTELAEGVRLWEFASARKGATGFSTGLATFLPGACLAYHFHPCGESTTILQGEAEVSVEGRTYHLVPFDSIHIPTGVPHAVSSIPSRGELIIHAALSAAEASSVWAEDRFRLQDRYCSLPQCNDPESLRRSREAAAYELSGNTSFIDLFGGRFGSRGICGGYGRFAPGSSLPCHFHEYDESITIVEGTATCQVEGKRYQLNGYATALIPKGLRHRFINESKNVMAMIWVYAGDEPERTVVDHGFCQD